MKTIQDFKVDAVKINCDFCGSDKFVTLFNKMRHDLHMTTVICENCALCFTNPQPTESTLGDFYESYYHLFHGRKEGGLLYIEVSNVNRPTNPYDWFLQFPRLFCFSQITLTNYLKNTGFEVVYLKETNNLVFFGKKCNGQSQNFVKTDIPALVKSIHKVDKIQKLAKKLPDWPRPFQKLKKILEQISV